MEPAYTSTRLLNEEMKNPHLVETVIHVIPSTGKRLENANPDADNLKRILTNKLTGKIPTYDVNFNVQGIPLLLTKQSYLEIRLSPKFSQQLQLTTKYLQVPLSFEYNRCLWPKVNASCVMSANATFSNFSVENQNPQLLPYVKYYCMSDDLRTNMSRNWNPSYLQLTDEGTFNYGNRYLTTSGMGSFQQPVHRSPYEVSAVKESDKNYGYLWYGQPLSVQIPLEDILPVFQVPVMPLRQTNTSNINIRMRLYSPQHMFFSAGYLNPSNASSFINPQAEEQNLDNGLVVLHEGIVRTYSVGAGAGDRGTDNSLEQLIVGNGTYQWLRAITTHPFAKFEDMKSFHVDFDVDIELVLKALTTPLLNPLVQSYIEPFVDEQNQFVAHFADYFTYSQTLLCDLRANTRFMFTPSQLFYNTTHIVLFFLQEPPKANTTPTLPKHLSGDMKVGNMGSLFQHSHFLLRNNINIKQFQIGLGSSVTPLFDRPLDMIEMMTATEDALRKYSPSEMYGDVMFIQNRFEEGDAFFMFDLTHARNSGYFIDADNMIRVEGVISLRETLDQKRLADGNLTQGVKPKSKALIGSNNNGNSQVQSNVALATMGIDVHTTNSMSSRMKPDNTTPINPYLRTQTASTNADVANTPTTTTRPYTGPTMVSSNRDLQDIINSRTSNFVDISTVGDVVLDGNPPTGIQRGNGEGGPNENETIIHVMMMLIWQNTFTVLLDLDGAVLFQQQ